MNIDELANDKPRVVALLRKVGILHNPRLCSTCKESMKIQLREKGADRWRCSKTGCKTEVGLRMNTFLENSKLPLSKIISFLHAWSENKTTLKYCKEQLGISKPTTVRLNDLLREVCAINLSHIITEESPYSARSDDVWKKLYNNKDIFVRIIRAIAKHFPPH